MKGIGVIRAYSDLDWMGEMMSTYVHKSKFITVLRHVHGVVIPKIGRLSCVIKRSCRCHSTMYQSAIEWYRCLTAHISQSRAYVAPNSFSGPWSQYASDPGTFVFQIFYVYPIINKYWHIAFQECLELDQEQTAFTQWSCLCVKHSSMLWSLVRDQ